MDNWDKIGEDDESTMLITVDENDDNENQKTKPNGCNNTSIAKTFKPLLV